MLHTVRLEEIPFVITTKVPIIPYYPNLIHFMKQEEEEKRGKKNSSRLCVSFNDERYRAEHVIG